MAIFVVAGRWSFAVVSQILLVFAVRCLYQRRWREIVHLESREMVKRTLRTSFARCSFVYSVSGGCVTWEVHKRDCAFWMRKENEQAVWWWNWNVGRQWKKNEENWNCSQELKKFMNTCIPNGELCNSIRPNPIHNPFQSCNSHLNPSHPPQPHVVVPGSPELGFPQQLCISGDSRWLFVGYSSGTGRLRCLEGLCGCVHFAFILYCSEGCIFRGEIIYFWGKILIKVIFTNLIYLAVF